MSLFDAVRLFAPSEIMCGIPNLRPQANKALRSQNVDLVQENMRLKAEVASRSPQK